MNFSRPHPQMRRRLEPKVAGRSMPFPPPPLGTLLPVVMAALAAIVVGCGGAGAHPTEATIGPAGGTIVGPAGSSLVVPAGALSVDTTLTIETLPRAAIPTGVALVGSPIRLGPEGSVFAAPVEVTLTVDVNALPAGKALTDVVVMTAPENSAAFVALPTSVAGPAQVVASTTHFSDFIPVVFTQGRRPCGAAATTYVSATPSGTEFFVLGDATGPTTGGSCFVHATVALGGSATIDSGEYVLDGSGVGTATLMQRDQLVVDFSTPPLSRVGAVTTQYVPLSTLSLTVVDMAPRVQITFGAAPTISTPLPSRLAALTPVDQATADQLATLILVVERLVEGRIPAYGGGAITRYVGTTTVFEGAMSGSVSVTVQSIITPNVTLAYQQMQEIPGVILDGTLTIAQNVQGVGVMSGTLTWTLRGPGGDVASGTFDAAQFDTDAALITGTGSGTLSVTSPTSASYPISSPTVTAYDLRTSFP